MGTTLSQRLSRISTLLIAAVGVAFAWFCLTLVFGLAGGHAHADDDSSLLGAVGSTLESSATTVTDTAGDVLGGATEAVQTVVTPVADVAEPVAPVVETVNEVAAPVVAVIEPVVDVAEEAAGAGVVGGVADAAADLVTAVPPVGDVATALGADDALTSVGTAADGVLQGTVGAVADTVTTPLVIPDLVGPAPVGGALDDIAAPLPGILSSTSSDAAPAAPATLSLFSAVRDTTGSTPVFSPPVAVEGAALFGAATGGLLMLLGSVLQADSVLTGPGGAGPGAWVLVALGFVVAYRAWVRRTGIEDDAAPPAPVFATDVSPD